MSDLLGTVYTLSTVLVFLIFSEGMAKMNKISKETARKIIHISVGNVIFFIPLFDSRWLAAGIPAVFVLGNYMLSPLSPIERLRLRTFKAGHAWGTILYPLALSITVFVFFSEPWLIIAAFFPVVYGDGFAAVFGPRAKTGKFTIFGNTKSLLGTSIIALFSWGSVGIGIFILGYNLELAIICGLFVAMIAPFVELLSPRGTDNLVIPIILSNILYNSQNTLMESSTNVDLYLYLIGLIFGLLFAIGGYLGNVLTSDGAITGFMITLYMLGVGNIAIGTQLFLFFVLGSGATKLVKGIAGKTQDEFEKGGERRDAIQAIAKAGIPAVLSFMFLITPTEAIFYIISGIMATAIIDTMATEIGIARQGYPFYVLTPWRRARPGQTGVISFQGTIGGIGFGLIFVLISGFLVTIDPFRPLDIDILGFIIVIVIAGTLGMLIDSILGSTIQRHNKCNTCEKIVEAKEHHNEPTTHIKGISWFNNDLTNITATSIGGLIAYLLLILVF